MKKKLFSFLIIICLVVVGFFFFKNSGLINPDDNSDDTTTSAGHTHQYDTSWSNDQMGHWHACTGDNLDECDAPTKDYGSHTYENGSCSTCGRPEN